MVKKLNDTIEKGFKEDIDELYRYLFIVRLRFGEDPIVDSFYKLVSPSGLTGDQMKIMTILKPDWEKESLKSDASTLRSMDLRLRFNQDMYQRVLMVRSEVELTAEDLEMYLIMKHKDGKLLETLKGMEI